MNPYKPNSLLLITSHCLLAFGCLLLMASTSVLAAGSDRDQQAEIEAGHWVDDPKKGYQVFSVSGYGEVLSVRISRNTCYIPGVRCVVVGHKEAKTIAQNSGKNTC